jgi:hypothetical protein
MILTALNPSLPCAGWAKTESLANPCHWSTETQQLYMIYHLGSNPALQASMPRQTLEHQ